MNSPKVKYATIYQSRLGKDSFRIVALCFRCIFISLYITFAHAVCLLIFLGFGPFFLSVFTSTNPTALIRMPSSNYSHCANEFSGEECAPISEWNSTTSNDMCNIHTTPSIHQWSCPDWILQFMHDPFKCDPTGCHQFLNPSVVFVPTRQLYFVIIKHFLVTRGFPCGHNLGYPYNWRRIIDQGRHLKPSLYTTDLYASHYKSLHSISYPSRWSFSKMEDNGENLWIDCRSFWILARLIVLCRNAKWMEIDTEDFSIIDDSHRLFIPGEDVLTMNNMQMFEANGKAYVLRSLTPNLEYCKVDLDSRICENLNRWPISLEMVHNTIKDIPKTHVHLSACCIKVTWKNKLALLGAGHYIYGGKDDAFYTNFFFLLSSSPPFFILAVSSEFQFQEDDPLEGQIPRMTVLPGGQTTKSGRFQFIVSILVESGRIILPYTMNDCYPRMVAIPLEQVLDSLLELPIKKSET